MPSSYRYQSLRSPATQIRLLELLPGHGIIRCRLKATDLVEAKGTYEPISYCWNACTHRHWWGVAYKEKKKKKQKAFRMRVDGAEFYISESLRAALRQLRLTAEIRLLWADAVCINQADDDEKSAQVAVMGNIYRSGKQTLVWLGDADCWTERAFRLLRSMSSHSIEASNSPESRGEPEDQPEYTRGEAGAKKTHPRYARLVWAACRSMLSNLALRSVLHRPYFERAWIVQEIVLSDNAVVMCGKHEITGHELYNGLHEIGWSRLLPEQAPSIQNSIVDLRKNPGLYCLDTIISKPSHTKASNPRDKLYSALGLHQNCMRCAGSVVVDYRKDIDEVFLDATKILLSRSPFLDILSMSYCNRVTRGPTSGNIPSWVWNPAPRSTEYDLSRAEGGTTYPFQASQGLESRPEFRGRMLGLLGYVFDQVRIVGNVLPPDLPYTTRLLRGHMMEAIRCYFSWVNISGICEQGITEAEANIRIYAFRCTIKPLKQKLSTVKMWYSNWDDDEDARTFKAFHAELMKRFSRFLSPGAKKANMRAKLEFWAAIQIFRWQIVWDEISASHRFDSFHDRSHETLRGRRVVRTENGVCGLCPQDTRPDDKLVLLQGANVPMVLRPSGKNWTLVGECFIFGAMYGELWDQERCEMLWIE